ncbi:MAG: RNase adapter RapZ [Candidatus Magnetoovum sp. WYHC-5]|nr:RNase adapter RapZ [Candidatus Magnetoovum sp. WYHC-5]
MTNPLVIIVSGLSGAGKTVVLRTLEDSGFFCVDNLPPYMIEDFIKISYTNPGISKIGVGIDIREKNFLDEADKVIPQLKGKYNIEIVFLEAETEVLLRRYKETRRPHPLSIVTDGNLASAIEMEKLLIEPLRKNSERIIDTSSYTPHQLRELIAASYGQLSGGAFKTTVISFGFKYGIPQNLDMMLDVRFLPNPHFIDELRPLTGLDEPVREFIFKQPATNEYLAKIKELLDFLIPQYKKEGKTYLTIGIGCTGGQHRAPALATKLFDIIKQHDIPVDIVHREI